MYCDFYLVGYYLLERRKLLVRDTSLSGRRVSAHCTQHKTIDISFQVEHNNWSVLDDNNALVAFMSSLLNFLLLFSLLPAQTQGSTD